LLVPVPHLLHLAQRLSQVGMLCPCQAHL
jgi:hypothetical protein